MIELPKKSFDAYARKMTPEKVIELRQRAANGESGVSLAREFGLSANCISTIIRGNSWKHVGGPISEKKTRKIIRGPRHEAKVNGNDYYFTGISCANGHLSDRRTSSGCCLVCAKERREKYGWEYSKKSNERNRDRYLALKRERGARFRERHPEANYNTVKRWRENNWDATLAQSHRRRALMNGAEGSFTSQDIKEIRNLQKNKCASCKATGALSIDHIIALASGGSNHKRNIQLLCKSCNSSKRHSDPIDFARREGRLL